MMRGKQTLLPISSRRWQWCFLLFSAFFNSEYPVEQSGAPHLPWDETHSLHFTLDTVHYGLLGFHTTPQSLGHLKETNISQRWDTVSCAPNKDHTLVGALKSPPCCIHLYGLAVVIQTIWGAEWICRDPWKKARPPTAIAHHSPSFPPRSGSIPSVPWGSPLKKRTSFTKTQIRQHMLPSFPPPPPRPNDQKGAWKNIDRQMGRLTLLWRRRRTSQCRRWTSAERGAVQMFWWDVVIVHISLLSTLLIVFFLFFVFFSKTCQSICETHTVFLSTAFQCFQSRLAVAVCVWSKGAADMNVLDKLQHSRVYWTWYTAQGQTTFTPTLPLVSLCYCNRSCGV